MIKKIALIFSCFLLFSCGGEKKADIPSNILPEQKMAAVMLDIHLLEAALSLNVYTSDQSTAKNKSPLFDVFLKHKITKKQYDESFEYYSQHQELLVEVYQLMMDNLSKMQAEVMNRKDDKKMKTDSIDSLKDIRSKIIKKMKNK